MSGAKVAASQPRRLFSFFCSSLKAAAELGRRLRAATQNLPEHRALPPQDQIGKRLAWGAAPRQALSSEALARIKAKAESRSQVSAKPRAPSAIGFGGAPSRAMQSRDCVAAGAWRVALNDDLKPQAKAALAIVCRRRRRRRPPTFARAPKGLALVARRPPKQTQSALTKSPLTKSPPAWV